MSITTSDAFSNFGAGSSRDVSTALSRAAWTLVNRAASAFRRLGEGRRKRHALSQLRSMDDRFLRDIGLARSAIDSSTFGSAREQARRWHV